MRVFQTIFLLLMFLLITNAVFAQFQVSAKFSEIPNLTYQLDCVADLPINCGRQNLGDLWKREFLKTDEDQKMLKEWARLRNFYNIEIHSNNDTNADALSMTLFDKIRIAGFQATTIEDYNSRLDLLTVPSDRADFEKVVRYFEPRFKVWWQTEAVTEGDKFALATNTLLRSPKITAPLKQIYNFYVPVLPDNYQITFNLFYIPGSIKESTNGQQIENYSLMEFKANEKPEQRIDVAIHELSHFFYGNMKPEIRAQIEKRFQEANRASAVPAYNLLNESLAAAFGNGMIARTVTPPDEFAKYLAAKNSFYNNDSIDRAAKAILPMLDDDLKNNRTIADATFVERYIAALEKSFDEDLQTPKLYLSEMFLLVDGKIQPSIRRQVRRKLETASFYASEGDWTEKNILDDYQNNPHLNSVFIVHPDNLDELVKNKIVSDVQLKTIQDEFNRTQQVLFATERAPFIHVYIIVAEDTDSALKQIEKLANAKQFKGIYKD